MNGATRRDLLCAAAAGMLHPLRGGAQSPPRQRRPNVLFISVDDLNRSLGCFGKRQVHTPNIDQFARRGVCFTGAQAQYASCLPSRVSFLSGWYPERTGVITFAPKPRDGKMKDVTYLPQHFRRNGYVTARIDKVFHIGSDDALSWDFAEEPIKDEQGRNRVVFTPREAEAQNLQPYIVRQGTFEKCRGEKQNFAAVNVDDAQLIDGINARRATELMERFASNGESFFLAVGFRRPHLPRILPKKYFDMYPPAKIQLPPQPPDYDSATWVSPEEHRQILAHYYAAVTYMDDKVGQILGALDRFGLRDNTIVVLFGDQGYCLGEKDNHFGKGTLGEGSFAVPLMVSAPGAAANGKSCDRIVQLLDLYPTLIDLCGLPKPAHELQGRSVRPLLADSRADWTELAIGAFGSKDNERPGLSVRTARYRYAETADKRPLAMYDYQTDPYEWNNLLADPKYDAERERLRQILHHDRT